MKYLQRRDQQFLLLLILINFLLIGTNFSSFLKRLVNTPLKFPYLNLEIHNATQVQNLPQWRQKEQAIWRTLTTVDLSPLPPETSTPVATVQLVQLPPLTVKEANSESNQNIPEATPKYERFLLVGDSTMYDLSIALNSYLRKQYNIKNVRADHRPSTGLNRRDYYDWHQKTPQFIEDYQADVLIAIFGGNERQGIRDNQGNYHPFSSPSWAKIYQQRVEAYAQRINESSLKKMYWVGQPISNVTSVNQFYPIINQIYQNVSEKYDKIEFVDTWNAFAVDGRFSAIVRDQSGKQSYVRVNDGVHFTHHGAKIIGQLVIDRLLQDQVILQPTILPPSRQ